MAHILIADDHAIARRGLKEIILDEFPLADIDTVDNTDDLLMKVFKNGWDLIISDITMPGRNILEILTEIHKEFPDLPVLIISVHSEEEYAVRVIKAGAAGFLNKDDAVESELVKAVDTILKGRKFITPGVAERMAFELSKGDDQQLPHELLSDREFHIFKLLAKGNSTRQIATQLSLSINTINTYRSRILTKMNLKNNAGIVAYAIRNNLTP